MALDTVDLDGKGPIANKKAQDHVARIQTIVVVIWGVLTHPPQIIQKIMLKKIKLTLPICKR
eukprot:SAG11_NODE_1092_length_5910_cov_3.131303_4_plen_61_part_01